MRRDRISSFKDLTVAEATAHPLAAAVHTTTNGIAVAAAVMAAEAIIAAAAMPIVAGAGSAGGIVLRELETGATMRGPRNGSKVK